MGILTGEIEDKTLKDKIHYNRGDVVRAETINDIQDTAIDAHNMATEALDKADSVFQGNGTVVSVGGREVGTLAFSSDPQQQLDTLNAKITTSSSFNAEIVDQLPTTNISTSTFYLIKNSISADDNTYSEYLYVNGKWELLGNTQVQAYDDSELRELINGLSTTKANKTDLANYYTKDQTYNITEVDAKVINLVSTSYLKSELNPIKTDVNTNKTNIATLQTDIVGKADKADLDNYTKTSDLAKVATSNDYNDLDNTPNTDLMVEIINEHSDSINEINTELAGKANKGEIPNISGLASETYVNTQVSTLQGNIDKKVDKTTTINSKPLSSNITLSASDVGALPNTTAIPKLYDDLGDNTDGAVTQKALYEIIISLGDEFGGAISELNTTKANQSDLDTTNANVSANTTAINDRYTKDEILNMFKIYADADTALKNRVTATETAISDLEDYKADKIDTQSQYNTLNTKKADKTELESAVTTLNKTIDDVRELIGESQGTVVRFGETPQPEVIFTSNPQDQIDALVEKTSDLVGKTYYVDGRAEGETFNDYDRNVASGVYSHAEGGQTDATGQYSHAEGFDSLASGQASHAEGSSTATGLYSHSEGRNTFAYGGYSHSEGLETIANHTASHASGYFTKTGRNHQTVMGTRNVGKTDTLLEVGNGYFDDITGNVINQNAFEVKEDGTLYTQNGTITDGINTVSLNNVASKDEIPTNYVTTDTNQDISGQKVFDDIHATNTITFHNNNANYNATYKGFIYQYKDQIDISRSKEADSSDFSGVFSLKLDSKELYVDGKKVASVENGMYLQGSTISVSFPAGDYSAGSTTTLISSAPANGWYTASVNVTGNSWFQCAGYSYRPQAVSNGYSIQFVIPVPKGSKLTFYASGATTVKNVYVSTFIQSKET